MKNKLVLLLISAFLILNGCSQKESKSEKSSFDGKNSQNESSEDFGISDSADINKEEPVRSRSVKESSLSALDLAIRSQNEEKIFSAATEVVSQNPYDSKGLNALSMHYFKKNRYELAEHLLKKALSKEKNMSALYNNLGIVQLALDEKREALAAFKKALDVNSKDAVANGNIGSIYSEERNYRGAIPFLEGAYGQNSRDLKILNSYAVALMATGSYEKSMSIFEEALKKNASHKECLYNYSILLVEHLKNYKKGSEILERLRYVGGPGDSYEKIITLENKIKSGLK